MAAAAGSGAELLGAPGEQPVLAATLTPEEIIRRLRSTRRELSNRRKILLRNLPAESSSQEVHDLLKDFDLKYCYVDKNKRTAFVTLLNGEQAQNVIRLFHQHSLRGKEISVQLQPTDALLCITNLPTSHTIQEFEELVRSYGNVERHFLIYSEYTGYSKGYGFVEYMKKDSAAKARLDLLGKQLGGYVLFAQWMDVNQLTPELIHSKCLCVENLPMDYTDGESLLQMFSSKYKPVFCQNDSIGQNEQLLHVYQRAVAYSRHEMSPDELSYFLCGLLEQIQKHFRPPASGLLINWYEELAQDEDSSVGGFAVIEYETTDQAEEVQQGTDGLAIRGKRVHVSYCAPGASGRGTLATLIAAQRMMRNSRKGLLPEPNAVQIMKSLNSPAMLQMLFQPQLRGCANKLAVVGAPMNLPHLVSPSVSPAFLHLNKVHQKPSLLGEPPAWLLHTMLGMGTVPPVNTDIGSHGEAHNLSNRTTVQTPVAAGIGMLPFFPNQHVAGQAMPRQNNTQDKLPSAVGLTEGAGSGSQAYLQNLINVTTGGLRTGLIQQQSSPQSTDSGSGNSSKNQTSLLGDPPKEIHLSTNPYLNLASVLPAVCLSANSSKASNTKQQTGLSNNSLDTAAAQGTTSQQAVENYFNYTPQYGDYAQDAVQQWYQQYAQAYHTVQSRAELENDGLEESDGGVYGDYGTYLQVLPSYYAAAQGSFHTGILPLTPQNPLKMAAVRNEKRGSSYLITSPEDGPVEYVGQHTQGSEANYAELYLKRKRVY